MKVPAYTIASSWDDMGTERARDEAKGAKVFFGTFKGVIIGALAGTAVATTAALLPALAPILVAGPVVGVCAWWPDRRAGERFDYSLAVRMPESTKRRSLPEGAGVCL
jgi:hypothetical protein